MKPGRELDALVAEKVFGQTANGYIQVCPQCGFDFKRGNNKAPGRMWCLDCSEWVYSEFKEYSTDIAAAWEVVEELVQDSWIVTVTQSEFAYSCYLECGPKARGKIEAFGQSPTHSICLAALKVIDSKFGTSQ